MEKKKMTTVSGHPVADKISLLSDFQLLVHPKIRTGQRVTRSCLLNSNTKY